jgi:phage gp36-like protein
MVFLTLADFNPQIHAQVFTLYQTSPTALDTIEVAAMQQVSGWISKFYDANAAFNPVPPVTRNGLLVMYMVDIILYHLSASMASIPPTREERFTIAVRFFEDVMRGRATMDLPLLPTNANGGQNTRYGESDSDAYF